MGLPIERDVTPVAAAWARRVAQALDQVPMKALNVEGHGSMLQVVCALAVTADVVGHIDATLTGPEFAVVAGVGDRVWQKRTRWLRENGWLRAGPGGLRGSTGGRRGGWTLITPGHESPNPASSAEIQVSAGSAGAREGAATAETGVGREQGLPARVPQRVRHRRTAELAQRVRAPWTAQEDAELAACRTDTDLEQFALRWSRTFKAVYQRRNWPKPN